MKFLKKGLDNQIKLALNKNETVFYRENHLQETMHKAKTAFYENQAEAPLSDAEFLVWQSRYIHKRWWVLQGVVLLTLWGLLQWAESSFYTQRAMGAAAPLFAVLLLPELWKNKSAHAIEIEGAAYYSLRQVYAARIFLFALVDCLLLSSFSLAAVLSGKTPVREIMVHFFLPYIVACCICFRTLYSKKTVSETFALLLCVVWHAIWTKFILNERVYNAISPSVWLAMLAVAILYLGYCIYKGQKNCNELWEVNTLWN